MTRARLERGRERYEIFCGTCHGSDGSGESIPASKMSLCKPPSLHEARIKREPVGQLYQVIRVGYGMMPAYAGVLTPDERWDVVAYVRALQLTNVGGTP